MANGMKTVKGRVLSSRPLERDWDEDSCLCQGPVPDEKRVDIQQLIYDEKRKKQRWRNMLRYHSDCPIHGIHVEDQTCPEA